jgi:hypothetical protein
LQHPQEATHVRLIVDLDQAVAKDPVGKELLRNNLSKSVFLFG